MEKRVFNYRGGGLYAVIGFLAIWSGGWLTGVVTSLNSSSVTINDRVHSPEEARPFMILMLGIGLLGLTGTLAMIGYVLNTRIEIENGEIRQYDLLGREKVRGLLKTATIQGDGENRAKIVTNGGEISVGTNISHYGALKTIVEDKAPVREEKRFARSSYVPPPQTFAARWGQNHLGSFVWLGGLGYMAYSSKVFAEGGMFTLVLALFTLPGIWMQLSGWFEKVRLGPEGIEYIDFLGRSRVRASLEEIVGGEWVKGSESSSVQIHTLRGTITVGNYYWRKAKVLAEVERLVAGRGA